MLRIKTAIVVFVVCIASISACFAGSFGDLQSGSWGTNGGGAWSTKTNWNTSRAAFGTNNTATFGNDITAGCVVTLTGSNFTPPFVIGNLSFSDGGSAGSAWELAGSQALTMDVTTGTPMITATTFATISAPLSGSDGLLLAVVGGLLLGGNNDYTGTTTLRSGEVRLGSSAALGASTSAIQIGDSGSDSLAISLLTNSALTVGRNLNVNNYGAAVTLGGRTAAVSSFTGSLALAKNVSLSAATDGAVSFTGGVSGAFTANLTGAGAVSVVNATAGTSNASFVAGAGGLRTIGGLHTSGTSTFSGFITLNRDLTLTAGGSSTVEFSGSIDDVGGAYNLTKIGSGAVLISHANTNFAGSTRVSEGTLILARTNALDSTAITVDSGATLTVQDGISVNSPITIEDGATVNAPADGSIVLADVSSYKGHKNTSNAGQKTVAQILGGIARGQRTLQSRWFAYQGGVTYGDVLDFQGTQGDVFILQMSYDESLLGATTEDSLVLGWYSGGTWHNAVHGNTSGTPLFVDGAYDGNLVLGHYGLDTVHNVVWAVVDHNSDFAAVPEPATMVLLTLGGLAVAARRRKQTVP